MNKISDGSNINPTRRSANPSAAPGSVKPAGQQRRPVQQQARKTSSVPAGRNAPKTGTVTAPRQVKRPAAQGSARNQVQRTAPDNAPKTVQRRPVNAAPKRPPQSVKKAQKQNESRPVNTGLIMKVLKIGRAHV